MTDHHHNSVHCVLLLMKLLDTSTSNNEENDYWRSIELTPSELNDDDIFVKTSSFCVLMI